MRIVLFVTDLQRGGTPQRLAALARGISAEGLDVTVGCLAPLGPIGRELSAEGIATFSCDASGPGDIMALWRFANSLRRIRPDLVHSTLMHANVSARLIARGMGIPVIGSTATIEVERPWHIMLERLTARLDRTHLVTSDALAEHVHANFHVPWKRIKVVAPTLPELPKRTSRAEARDALHLPQDAFVVLWAGRFDPVKRVEFAIGCIERLANPAAHLLLAGDGPCADRINARAKSSPAAKRIHPLGWLTDLGQAMSAADAFIFPSRTEGLPNAVVQAMAFGLPVVASDIPPLRELAGDPPRISLVDPHDEGAFADALRRIERNKQMAERASAWVREQCDPMRSVRATIKEYQRALGAKND